MNETYDKRLNISDIKKNKIDSKYLYLTKYKGIRMSIVTIISILFYLGLSGICQLFQPIDLDVIIVIISLLIFILVCLIRYIGVSRICHRISHEYSKKIRNEYFTCMMLPSVILYTIAGIISYMDLVHIRYIAGIILYCIFCSAPLIFYMVNINSIIKTVYKYKISNY